MLKSIVNQIIMPYLNATSKINTLFDFYIKIQEAKQLKIKPYFF